jgi:hypothetical protein
MTNTEQGNSFSSGADKAPSKVLTTRIINDRVIHLLCNGVHIGGVQYEDNAAGKGWRSYKIGGGKVDFGRKQFVTPFEAAHTRWSRQVAEKFSSAYGNILADRIKASGAPLRAECQG